MEVTKPRKTLSKRVILIGVIVLLIVALGVFWLVTRNRTDDVAGKDDSKLSKTVANLPERPGLHPDMRLAKDLIPPTNKWFSSVVFSKEPQPIYAYPMTFKPTSQGFETSYPNISGTADAIFQIHHPDIIVDMGADSYQVDAYDELTVKIGYYNSAKEKIATVTVAHGSPYLFIETTQSTKIAIENVTPGQQANTNFFSIKRGDRTYEVTSDDDLETTNNSISSDIPAGKTVSVFAAPTGTDTNELRAAALRPLTNSTVSYSESSQGIKTTLGLKTKGNEPTVFAALPHQKFENATAIGGTYQSLYGTMQLYSGNDFSYTSATPELPEKLDLSRLSSDKKTELTTQVKADIAATTLNKTDSYFAAKELYRAANLVELADQLQLNEERDGLVQMMSNRLNEWFTVSKNPADTARYFYYDTTIKGVVGVEPAFGSDKFNDHHFHYGYFIYAASITAKYNPDFLAKNRDMVDVLVADLVGSDVSAVFPKSRVFDPYVAHSWASGYGDFADGNNQESVSEAVNAWYGMYLWSKVTNNEPMQRQSKWLYANESQSALNYWFLKEGAPAKEYPHPFVSLIWGGKLDYSTFFSPRPQAKLGILLIPMSPGQAYLKQSGPQIKKFLASVQPSAEDFHGQFGDYLLMFESLADPVSAASKAKQLLPTDIDDGNSRSYTLAWIYSNLEK